MGRSPSVFAAGVALAGLCASCGPWAIPAAAACSEPGSPGESPRVEARAESPDFFVGRPHGWVGARGGWFFAAAGGDLFDFVEQQLTLEDGDFRAPLLGVSAGVMLTPRIDLVVAFDYSQSLADSEFRDYVDEDLLPITQKTELTEASLSFSGTYALWPRYRQVSRFASVLRRVAPYVGGGIGLVNYEFLQTGDFVDFADLSIFRTTLRSEGWALSGHAVGGADFQLHRAWFATFEARYTWADAEPGDAFVGFETLDLSGLRLSFGVSRVF